MDKEVFIQQMERLKDLFGVKNYNPDRAQLIWKEVHQLSDEWMIRTTDHFVGTCRQPPLIAEFREEISKERDRLWRIQKSVHKTEAERVDLSRFLCDDCTNTGLVVKDHDGQQFYAFRCHCDHGLKRPENLPRLNYGELRVVSSKKMRPS